MGGFPPDVNCSIQHPQLLSGRHSLSICLFVYWVWSDRWFLVSCQSVRFLRVGERKHLTNIGCLARDKFIFYDTVNILSSYASRMWKSGMPKAWGQWQSHMKVIDAHSLMAMHMERYNRREAVRFLIPEGTVAQRAGFCCVQKLYILVVTVGRFGSLTLT